MEYAGKHILIDIWGAAHLDDATRLESAMREAVESANATLIHYHSHQFTPSGGLSATAILAESHLNVHTWPERQFAAFDVFMCGGANPEAVVDVLKHHYQPKEIRVESKLRGRKTIESGT